MLTTPPSASTGKNNFTATAQWLKQVFSRKDVSMACLLLAIIARILLSFYFNQLDWDKLFQAMAGKNFIEGHGFTIKQVHVNDLSKEYYEPLQGWPYGYSILAGIAYWFVHNLGRACLVLDVIFAVLYFIILKKLFKQLGFPAYVSNLALLLTGAAIPFYVTDSWPTDFISLVLLIYLCSLALQSFSGKQSIRQTLWLAVVNCLAVWFKYMYLPVTFILPAFLLWNGWQQKNKKLFNTGLIVLVAAILSTGLLLAIRIPYSQPANYVNISGRGLFWHNLLNLYPFFISAFITLDFYLTQIGTLTKLNYSTWLTLLKWINLLLFACMLVRFVYFSFQKKWTGHSPWAVFTLLSGAMGICLLAVLAYMSLTYDNHFPAPRILVWTYLAEERYLVLPEFVALLLAIRWLFLQKSNTFRLQKALQALFVMIVVLETAHCTYFLLKNFTVDRRHFAQVAKDKRFTDYIQQVIQENRKKNIDVVFTNSTMANRSVLMGGKGLFQFTELNYPDIHASKPTLLIAVIINYERPYYQAFLNKPGVQLIHTINDHGFYAYYATPAGPLSR